MNEFSAPVLACFIGVGAVLNRFSGSTNLEWLPGRNVYWASVIVLFLVSVFYGLLWGALAFVSVLCYRLPGWNDTIDIGYDSGKPFDEWVFMTLRTMYLAPLFLYAAIATEDPWHLTILGYVAIAASVSYAFGNWILRKYFSKWVKDPFVTIEASVGAAIGAGMGMALEYIRLGM